MPKSYRQHCLSKLLDFTYTTEYKPGKHNLVVDALPEVDSDDSAIKSENKDNPQTWSLFVSASIYHMLDQIRSETEADHKLLEIHQQLNQGTLLDPYYSCKSEG